MSTRVKEGFNLLKCIKYLGFIGELHWATPLNFSIQVFPVQLPHVYKVCLTNIWGENESFKEFAVWYSTSIALLHKSIC